MVVIIPTIKQKEKGQYTNYRVRQKKVDPWSFSPFSQQKFGILIWNFIALFTETFYI